MKKSVLKEFEGQDKLVGRPIRLNRIELKVNEKGYAPLLFFGDLHWGHPQCNKKKALDMLKWAEKEQVQILLMGDLLEAGLRDSVGDSVYQQNLNPQEQMEEVVELLRPIQHLIVGLHCGNHEQRITKATGIDISKIMSKFLKVPYLGYSCWSLVKVGEQNYTMYSTHGASGSRFKHTKLKAVMDLAAWIDADVIAMGHVHSKTAEEIIKQSVSLKDKTVKEKKCYAVLTGAYLNWDRSYAQVLNMPITGIGSPKAKFLATTHDVHFSL